MIKHDSVLFFPLQAVEMPRSGTPAPPNTKKKPCKIITDLSNITQNGQYTVSVGFYVKYVLCTYTV